jgi:hypothetical protein
MILIVIVYNNEDNSNWVGMAENLEYNISYGNYMIK